MIGRLNHVAIAVRDLDAACAIYRDTLGATVTEPLPQPEHGVTVVDVFRAYTGGARAIIERVVAAGVMAPRYQAKLEAKLR